MIHLVNVSDTNKIVSLIKNMATITRDVNEAMTLEAEAEARTLEARAEAKAEFMQFWPSEL